MSGEVGCIQNCISSEMASCFVVEWRFVFTEHEHDTPGIAARNRDYDLIFEAGRTAAEAVLREDTGQLVRPYA